MSCRSPLLASFSAAPRAVLLALSLLIVSSASCDGGRGVTSPEEGAVFVINTCRGSLDAPEGYLFRVLTRDPGVIAEGTRLVGAGPEKIVFGFVATGSGGFNSPWAWHLIPETVQFVDLATEVCDACTILGGEDAVQWWIDNVGSFCPWTTEVVRRER